MTATAKLFRNGGSQAVRLPKSCSFPSETKAVVAHRVGRSVILEPADTWTEDFLSCLGAWKEPIERPQSRLITKLEDPFE